MPCGIGPSAARILDRCLPPNKKQAVALHEVSHHSQARELLYDSTPVCGRCGALLKGRGRDCVAEFLRQEILFLVGAVEGCIGI